MLTLRFTKVSATHHRLEYRRSDGSGEAAELETRSFFLHDLIHLALESEAGLAHSFYGLLEQGHGYAELSAKDPLQGLTVDRDELGATESVVGPLTPVVQGRTSVDGFLHGMRQLFSAHAMEFPRWLDAALVMRTLERLRRLQGQWKATPFGRTMELRFPLE